MVARHLGDVGLATIAQGISDIGPLQWLIALVATALSFAAAGQYDALFHRWLGTGVRHRRAAVSGAAAIALAQTLGFGLATGSVVRWRALPELSLPAALRVTNYVSFTFMAALALLSGTAVAMLGDTAGGTVAFAFLSLMAILLGFVLSLVQPVWLPFPMPPLRLVARLTVLAAADTALAALALWVLIPIGAQPEFGVFLAAFLVALGAGLVSGAPGGVGPFELTLVTLLPAAREAELVAAVLAFRLVYYALPACASLVILARPSEDRNSVRPNNSAPRVVVRAEAGLARQSGYLSDVCGVGLHLAQTSQCLVALGAPVCGSRMTHAALKAFVTNAKSHDLYPALYKVDGRTAAVARRAGWSILATSEEAWLSPANFSMHLPERRQLRRKLGQARKAGVTIEPAHTLPLTEMSRVSRDWAGRMGRERGFSMGRFCPDYLAGQRVWLAWHDERLVAFASFHSGKFEWTLDLLRSVENVPDGTMHALMVAALEAARIEGVARVSLAAMPLESDQPVLKRIAGRRDALGLRRFKTSFHPRCRALYLAAPNPALLALAGADILLRIAKPSPLSAGRDPDLDTMQKMQGGNTKTVVVPYAARAHVGANGRQTTKETNQ